MNPPPAIETTPEVEAILVEWRHFKSEWMYPLLGAGAALVVLAMLALAVTP